MKPHRLRSALWVSNGLFALAVIGAAAWFFLDVMPAAGDSARLNPPWTKEATDEYSRRTPKAKSEAPVSQEQVAEIDRPEYQRLNYWIFSGPPVPAEGPKTEAVKAAAPLEGLEALGRPVMLMYAPAPYPSTLVWEFAGTKDRWYLEPGDFFQKTDDDPKRFRFLGAARHGDPALDRFKIRYAVHDDPAAPPVKEAELIYDALPPVEGPEVIRVRTPAAAAGEAGEATAAATAQAAGTARAGTVQPADEGARPAAATAPAAETARPTITRTRDGGYQVEFEDAAYQRLKSRKFEDIAETVRTHEAKDAQGRPLGLQIVGLGDEAADFFDVKKGDILISIDGRKVTDRAAAINIVKSIDPNTPRVAVVIERNGKQITYNIDPRDPATRRRARYLENQ
jgi:hypothetical protein